LSAIGQVIWRFLYVFFARAGFTPVAQQIANEPNCIMVDLARLGSADSAPSKIDNSSSRSLHFRRKPPDFNAAMPLNLKDLGVSNPFLRV